MGIALRWCSLPFLALLFQSMLVELWFSSRAAGLSPETLIHGPSVFFMLGLAFRILFAALCRRFRRIDPLVFVDTLEHELTHALIGTLTFCPPISLSATLKSGGEVQLRGSNPLAALAPYAFPLWTLVAVAIGFVVQSGLQSAWTHAVFFLLGCFAYRLGTEFRWRQTDLHAYGFFFSTLLVGALLLLSLGIILKSRGLLSLHWIWASPLHAIREVPGVWRALRPASNSTGP